MRDLSVSIQDNRLKSERSKALDLLRFPLACVIVWVHTFVRSGITLQGNEYEYTFHGLMSHVRALTEAFLSCNSVPIYFVISGFVFFLGINLTMNKYRDKMRNRFWSLFIPYIAWNTLAVLLMLVSYLPFLSHLFVTHGDAHLSFGISNILNEFWNTNYGIVEHVGEVGDRGPSPADFPMWYVRDLMIVAVTTPLLNILFKSTRYLFVLAMGVLWFVFSSRELGHLYQLITAYFFFSLGAYMSFKGKDMMIVFKKFRTVSFVLFPVISLFLYWYAMSDFEIWNGVTDRGYTGWSYYVKNVGILAALPFAYNLAMWLIERFKLKGSKFLAGASFFIYAAHGLFITKLVRLLYLCGFRPDTQLGLFLLQLSADILLMAGLLIIYKFLQHHWRWARIAFAGGRA